MSRVLGSLYPSLKNDCALIRSFNEQKFIGNFNEFLPFTSVELAFRGDLCQRLTNLKKVTVYCESLVWDREFLTWVRYKYRLGKSFFSM